ncbi:MAG: TldD/PmbA family protein [Clostridiales bacterium]|nr:TldD/PmbA family protein [Clostridiales bacterium]
MDMNLFTDLLLQKAKEAGIDPAEVYYNAADSFRAGAREGEIESYQVSTSAGLSLRGSVGGKMGYASTQAFDEDAITQLIQGVKESAALVESAEQDEIFEGEESYPVLPESDSDLEGISAEEKLNLCLEIDKKTKAGDPRIAQVQRAMVATAKGTLLLKNSYGLNLKDEGSTASAMVSCISRDEGASEIGFGFAVGNRFDSLDADKIAADAVKMATERLHSTSLPTGEYRVIFNHEAMSDLLGVFCSVFSADRAQQNLSLLAGKEGQTIASDVVTIMDDPLLPGGRSTSTFDAEGTASRTKAIVDKGVLTTLLHNRKTARKQGVASTGNAVRAGYTSPVAVGPTNFFIKPGEKTLDELIAQVENGVVIEDLGGLHAGANAASGDFSLIAKGYTVKDGQRDHAVSQITVAGNFYQLLKNIRCVANDIIFSNSVCSPSVDAGVLKLSGQ